MGSPALFAGNYVKFLKDQLQLTDKARILTGAHNPTLVAKDAPSGSVYMRLGSFPSFFKKMDSGLTLNWKEIKSSDDFSIVRTQGAVAVIGGGMTVLSDGRILMTYIGAGSSLSSFGLDLNVSVGFSAGECHIYVDLNTLAAIPVDITDAPFSVYPVQGANTVILTTRPELTDLSRYIHVGSVDSGVSSLVSLPSPSVKQPLPIKFTNPTVYTLPSQVIGSVGTVGQIKQGHILSSVSFPSTTSTSWYNLSSVVDGNSSLSHNLTNNGGVSFSNSDILGGAGAAGLSSGFWLSSTDIHFNTGNGVSFTGGGWFGLNSWSIGTQILFSQIGNVSTDLGWSVTCNAGVIEVRGTNSATSFDTTATSTVSMGFAAGSYHHIVIRYNYATLRLELIIDGVLIDSKYLANIRTVTSPKFNINGQVTGLNGFTGYADEFFFSNGTALPDEDVRKIASYRLDHNKNTNSQKQSWVAVRTRNDGKIVEEVADKSWLVDQSNANSLYVDFSDYSATDLIELRLSDETQTAALTAPNKTFDTGWLTSVPLATYIHGLPDAPTAAAVIYEKSAGVYVTLVTDDYIDWSNTTVNCDITAFGLLTIGASNKVRIVIGSGASVLAVSAVSATQSGIVTLGDQTMGAGIKAFNGGMKWKVTAVTGTYAVLTTDHIVRATGAVAYNITLPLSAAGNKGQEYVIKSAANAGVLLTILTTSSQTIDALTTLNLARFDALRVISNGSGWDIV